MRKVLIVRAAGVGLTAALAAGGTTDLATGEQDDQEIVRTFDVERADAPPPGFVFAQTRQARPGTWVVQRDGSNGLLAQLGDDSRRDGFALAILPEARLRGVRASVRLKLAGGERSGGLVWRYQDAENYYLAALNLARQEIAVFRVVRGNRIRIESEDDLELDAEAWHVLRVVHEDESIRVYLGGIRVFRARDRTFRGSGSVGLWSAGGSVSYFDDLRVEEEHDDD